MSRHVALRTMTSEKKWTGITADIVLPKTVDVKDGYVDWYFGIGEAHIEGGISRTPQGYKVFLGTGHEYGAMYWSSVYDNSIMDGERINLKLVHDYANKKLKMYVRGVLVLDQPIATQLYSLRGLSKFDKAKMVIGVEDSGKNSHSQASFSQVKLRSDESGSVYKDFNGDIQFGFSKVLIDGAGITTDYKVHSAVPLSGTLLVRK